MALPKVLAGPIVRHVDNGTACIWIALSSAATVQLTVFPGDQVSTGPATVQSGSASIAQSEETPTVQLGDKLHVVTVAVRTPLPPIPPEHGEHDPLPPPASTILLPSSLFSYDVVVDGQGLLALGLLDDTTSIPGLDPSAPKRLPLGYLPQRLPGFATTGRIEDLRIIHASCRKPHGKNPDALAWLDDEIEDHRNNPLDRPQQLFLTGDQIYADDVAGVLLPMLSGLSNELLGYDEVVPISGGVATGNARHPTKDLPTLRRARLVLEVARFTTTAGASHLLGFGEYAAMYLAAWSPLVWRQLDPTSLHGAVSEATREQLHLTDFEGRHGGTHEWSAADHRGPDGRAAETAAVEVFRQAVPHVARALANCSTYMIFDDHEVTDDWNITQEWRTRTLTSALGRTVTRNGLLAYTYFQATGNDRRWLDAHKEPVTGSDRTNEQKLFAASKALLEARAAPTVTLENAVDALLGLSDPTAAPKVPYHYTVFGQMHRVNVLDTRTRRTWVSGFRYRPPSLLGDSLNSMLAPGPMGDGRELLVIVSPAPVLFPRLFDALVQPMAAAVFDFKTHMVRTDEFDPRNPEPISIGAEEYDIEGWAADEAAFHALMRRMASYPRVVVLSGDVHFASSLVADVWSADDELASSRIVQCTSSAAKNPPSTTQQAILRTQRTAQRLLRGSVMERLGWDGAPGLTVPGDELVTPARRGRMQAEPPTYLPAEGWPAGTVLSGDPVKVRYRVTVLRDDRARAERGVGVPTPPMLPVWNGSDPIATYADVAGAHQLLLAADALAPNRLMLFGSNIGRISFERDGDDYEVAHELLSAVGDGTSGSPFTRHAVRLHPTAAGAPPMLTTEG